MTAKRRRKRRPPRQPEATPIERRESKAEGPAAEPEAAPRRTGLFGAAGIPSPYPPFGASVARGLRAVGASPVILGVAFLSLLATWGAFVALGGEGSPRLVALIMSAPPFELFFTDLNAALRQIPDVWATLVAVLGLGVLRAVSWGLLLPLTLDAVSGGRPDVRSALRRLPKLAANLTALYLLEASLFVVLFQIVGAFLGQLTFLVVLAAGYFLVMAAPIAAAEGSSAFDAFRRAARAARLPGLRHLGLTAAYFFFLYYLLITTPFGLITTATPGLGVWAFAMVATFVHVGMAGAFAFRWTVVREEVPAPPRRRSAGRA